MTERVTLACPSCQIHRTGSPVHATFCEDCDELMEVVNGPFRDGKVFVCEKKCSTCIFRPGNLMHLQEGRVEQMSADAIANNSGIVCHKTLDGDRSICRGFWDVHGDKVWVFRLAQHLKILAFDNPDKP